MNPGTIAALAGPLAGASKNAGACNKLATSSHSESEPNTYLVSHRRFGIDC
jgi:hypothetical protein